MAEPYTFYVRAVDLDARDRGPDKRSMDSRIIADISYHDARRKPHGGRRGY
jgi:hypothetical protein